MMRNMKYACVWLVISLWFSTSNSWAATKFWKNSVGSGNWGDGNNWSNVSAAGADNGGIPGNNDTVNISPTVGAGRTITYDVASPTLNYLTIDLTGAGTNRTTFEKNNSANLNLMNGIVIGDYGRATFNHSDGLVAYSNINLDAVVGFHAGGDGIYNLSGTGTLSVARGLYVGTFGPDVMAPGSIGQFNQTGGSVTAKSLILAANAGATGTYTISGGSVTTTDGALIGNVGNGIGTLNIQNSGTVYVTNNLAINNTSNVNLDGGTLRFNTASGLNRLNYTSGTIQLAGNRDFSTDTTIGNLFPSSTIPIGKKLLVEGSTTIQIAIEMIDGGEMVSQGTLNVGSTYAGYLKVLNGGKVVAASSSSIGSGAHGINIVSGAGSNWTIGGDLTIGGNDLRIDNQGTLYVGGAINFSSGVAGDEINLNGGTLRFNSYSNSSRLSYTAGTIQLAGDRSIGTDATISAFYGSQPTIPSGKQLTVEGTATVATSNLTLAGGTLSAETLILSPASRVRATQASTVSGRVLGLAGSVIDASGANLTFGNATEVNGFGTQGNLVVGASTVSLLDSNDVVFDSLSLATLGTGANPGTLNAANGLTLNFGGNITGFGTVSTPNNIAKPLINNGHITGTSLAQPLTLPGYVKGVGTFDNVSFTGTFSPGLSPTSLSVGNLALSPTSTLVMELGGTSPGSSYDQLLSSSQLVFDGVLDVSLINGFVPTMGQSFELFDWTSVSGTFDALALPSLSVGLSWNTSQLYTTGVLTVGAGLTGDFDSDGDVDGHDFLVWQRGDSPGGINSGDLALWQSQYGTPPLASSRAVPEPTTALLSAMCLLGVLFPRCR